MSKMTNQSHSKQYVHPSEVEYFQASSHGKPFLYNVIENEVKIRTRKKKNSLQLMQNIYYY
jgi:hypothetical protein